jgi:spore germination protein
MMMNNPTQKIALSNSTLFAVLVVTMKGSNFLDLPYYAAKYGGPSGYWSVIIAFILISLVVLLAIAFINRFPNQNLFEVAPGVIGKPLALIGNMLFLGSFFIQLTLAVRDGVYLVDTYLLNLTPLLIIMLIILVSIAYLVMNGLAAVSRFITFLLIPIFILRVVMELLSLQKIEVTNLLPLFSETPGQYLIGGMALTGYFIPITAIFLLSNRLQKPAKLGSVLFGALGAIFPIYFLAFIGTVGIFGAKYTQSFNWPELPATNHVNIPFLGIEQLGLLLLIIWLTTFFATKTFYAYIVASGSKQQFPVFKYRWITIVILFLAGVIGLNLHSNTAIHQFFAQTRPWLMIPVAAYPLIVYIIALLRGKRGNRIEA